MTFFTEPPAMGPNTGTIAYDQLDLPFPAIGNVHGRGPKSRAGLIA